MLGLSAESASWRRSGIARLIRRWFPYPPADLLGVAAGRPSDVPCRTYGR